MSRKVNIVGAGFVGLTLAEVLSGQTTVSKVTVLDVDENKIEELKKGCIPVKEADLNLKSKKLKFVSKVEDTEGDIYFICVGTPNRNGVQVIDYLELAIASVIGFNKRATIILKSTTLPENVERLSKLVDPIFGKFFTSPEFMAEGKAVADLRNQPQLIVGTSENDKEYITKVMSDLFKGTYKDLSVVGIKEAMVIKYFLNSYKAQKLNFINDFAWYCAENDMKFSEVIGSINDPVMGEGFDKPGVGFGGSCFPKDTQAMGSHILSCMVAYESNRVRVKKFTEALLTEIGSDNNQPILLFGGKAFKNGTNDTRESVSIKVAKYFKSAMPGAHIYFYDMLPEISDLTLDEVKSNKDKFDAVVVFNELPELIDVFKDNKVAVYDTRAFK